MYSYIFRNAWPGLQLICHALQDLQFTSYVNCLCFCINILHQQMWFHPTPVMRDTSHVPGEYWKETFLKKDNKGLHEYNN